MDTPVSDLERQNTRTATTVERGRANSWLPDRRSVLYGALTSLVLSAGILGGASLYIGSPTAALAYIGGARLIYTPEVVLPPESRQEREFRAAVTVRNMAGHPVTIVGASRTCACVSPTDLPVVLEPWQEASLEILVQRSSPEEDMDQAIVFFTDYSAASKLAVRIHD